VPAAGSGEDIPPGRSMFVGTYTLDRPALLPCHPLSFPAGCSFLSLPSLLAPARRRVARASGANM
jgi:hypothetical protein